MLKRIFYIWLFSLIIFTFNVNSAEVKFGTAVIISQEIKSGIDPEKNKITVKNAEVKFSDGSVYIGSIKKNKIHGKGTLKVFGGQTYEGKFKKNKFIKKISRKNRTALSIDFKKGITVKNQIKVSGLTKWYPAIIEGGEFKLSKKGELMASQDKKTLDGGGSGGGSGC